jgi:hypothetical protein
MVTYSTILLCFLLRERGRDSVRERRRRRRRRRRRGRDASFPIARIFKTGPTLVIYKILEKTLVL